AVLATLRAAQPALPIVLVAPAAAEVALAPLCQRLGLHLLLQPLSAASVAAALEQALLHSDRPREDVFLDLARGIADEINNPLMYVSGYLQLLKASFDPQRDRDRSDQLTAALDGVHRIQEIVDRIRLLARAAAGKQNVQPLDLAALLAAAAPDAVATAAAGAPGRAAATTVLADPELLVPAVRMFCQVGADLRGLGCTVELETAALAGGVRLRMRVHGQGLASWQLPRTFEPYYLGRLLRGTGHGMALFLVQTVVHAHGGQATARRQLDGSLHFDLWLPRP
ncbi:MAG TPA: histidine kinase dimerization/phospho-acceptor domain-containing protein, partial [Planctomycetota bacterium]|nr:histidine kinase dimerization/phospho-acceptor domain-containing protein [Planctomycetota bacterium]